MATLNDIMERLRTLVQDRERSLRQLRSLLENLENLSSTLSDDELRGFEKALNDHDAVRKVFDRAAPKRQRGVVPPAEIASAVRRVLLDANRPMRRGELVAELEKLGTPLGGVDRNKNLGTILWRHKNQFIQLDKLGYWLKDVPLEGIYTPHE